MTNTGYSLFNNKEISSSELKILFDQYKLYIESTDKFTGYRNQANTFFLTLNTALVGFAASILELFPTTNFVWLTIICVTGILFSVSWYFIVRSYRTLNSARFDVIHELESKLPAKLYKWEWEILMNRKPRHIPMTHVEQVIPVAYLILYICIDLYAFLS